MPGRHAAKGHPDHQERGGRNQKSQGGSPGSEELSPQDLAGPEQGHLQDGQGAAGTVAVHGVGRECRRHKQGEKQDKGQNNFKNH